VAVFYQHLTSRESEMKHRFVAVTASLLLCGSLAVPAQAGKRDDTLNIGWTRVIETNDVYFNQGVREGMVIGRLIWDNLVERDPITNDYKPLLATSYKWVDDKTLDFELRQGVTFHNGAPFSADDVVFTLNWASDPANKVSVPIMVNWIKQAEKTGPYSVRIHLKEPFPAALEYLSAAVPIYPHEYYAKVGPKGMSEAPIGTGPYKAVSAQPGRTITLVKNENYMKGGPKRVPTIGKIVQRTIADEQTLVAELLSGRLDWIWNFGADTADNLRRRPQYRVLEGETMRIGFVSFNAAAVGGPNPMTDVRVRRAVAHAIDRDTITKNLIRGSARVLKAACYPSQFGCDQAIPQYEYNPAKAKALLAEAGFPNGLTIDLYGYLDRTHTEAIMGQLAAVGIKTNLQWLQFGPMFTALQQGKAPMTHLTTGAWSINDVSITLRGSFAGGPWDIARDPELIKWVMEADNVVDPNVRKALYKKSLERIQDQVYWLPLNTYYITYAHVNELDFETHADEVARFYDSKWK
jgi:peptide/nickel transport system substrate-binding protein